MYVIDKLYDILEKNAKVIFDDSADPENDPKYIPLEKLLQDFSSFYDDNNDGEDDLDPTIYKKLNGKTSASPKVVKTESKYWKSGTGFSTSDTGWNPDQYVKMQKERDQQLINSLDKILGFIQEVKFDDYGMYPIIQKSCLIPFIQSKLYGVTIMDITKHKTVYHLIFSILMFLSGENSIHLFDDYKTGKQNLHKCLQELKTRAQLYLKMNKDIDEDYEIISTIITIEELVSTTFSFYLKAIKKPTDEKLKKAIVKKSKVTDQQLYVDILDKDDAKFDSCNILSRRYYYAETASTSVPRKVSRAIALDYSTLMETVSVHFNSSVYFRNDENNIRVSRALITGPDNTPYDSGCYVFDICMPADYPNSPPKVWLVTTGGKRFNPNLYANGKVCLSLLGTWSGGRGEGWIPGTSTLSQVLFSIQSLILVENPYFNEPGYERIMGSTKGNMETRNYNIRRRLYNMEHTMLNLLENNPYPEFTDVIRNHFKIKKDYILHQMKVWMDEVINLKDTETVKEEVLGQYNLVYNKLSKILKTL
jgi:ubiquitin-protein ligase